MDSAALRARQAPLKERYRDDPTVALTPAGAHGRWPVGEVAFDVDQQSGPCRAGLHRATGGDGTDACSADLLMEALLACAGVTLHAVATSMGLEVRSCTGVAECVFDARGTLAVDRRAPVGVQDVVVTFSLDTDADDVTLGRLATAVERYCVVGASLATPPRILVGRA